MQMVLGQSRFAPFGLPFLGADQRCYEWQMHDCILTIIPVS